MNLLKWLKTLGDIEGKELVGVAVDTYFDLSIIKGGEVAMLENLKRSSFRLSQLETQIKNDEKSGRERAPEKIKERNRSLVVHKLTIAVCKKGLGLTK